MRENRLYGSEGGVAKAIPTPILSQPPFKFARAGLCIVANLAANVSVGVTSMHPGCLTATVKVPL